MMDPVKLKTKNQKNRPLLVEPDDHVTIGNKPKSKIYSKGPKLLTKQNQVVLINLKPKIPANPDQPLDNPKKSDLRVIPVREDRCLSFEIRLQLPENSNPFYNTETHRQSYIKEQLYSVIQDLGFSHNYHKHGELDFETFVEELENKGYDVEIMMPELAHET